MTIQSATNTPSVLNYSLPLPHGRPWVVLTPYVKNLDDATMNDIFRQLKDSATQIQKLSDAIIKDSTTKPLGEIIFSLVLSHMRLPELPMSSSTDSLRALYDYCSPFDENLFRQDPKEHLRQRVCVLHETRAQIFDLTLGEIEKVTGEALPLPAEKFPCGLVKKELLPLLRILFLHRFPLRVLYRETHNPFSPFVLSPFQHLFMLLEGLEARSLQVHYHIKNRLEKDPSLLPSSYSPAEIRLLEQCLQVVRQRPN